MIAVSYHYRGNHSGAWRHIERFLADDVTHDSGSRIIRFQLDQRLAARAFLARILWLQGFPAQAMETAESTIEQARALGHANSLCHALAHAACPIALWVGNFELAEYYISLLLDYSAKHALALSRSYGRAQWGVLLIERGDLQGGLLLVRTGFDEFGAASTGFRVLVLRGTVAAALGSAGQIADGLVAIEAAIDRSEQIKEGWAIPELLRIKGELLLLQGGQGAVAEAEDHFRRALDWARRQGALSWELRATTSLGRLLRDQGCPTEAMALLRPVYDRFTEGFETADLKAAKALLDALQ
jgi:tetratricopeptide (TPR) repeat protein